MPKIGILHPWPFWGARLKTPFTVCNLHRSIENIPVYSFQFQDFRMLYMLFFHKNWLLARGVICSPYIIYIYIVRSMFILNSRFKKLFGLSNYSTSAYQTTISGVSAAAWVAILCQTYPQAKSPSWFKQPDHKIDILSHHHYTLCCWDSSTTMISFKRFFFVCRHTC